MFIDPASFRSNIDQSEHTMEGHHGKGEPSRPNGSVPELGSASRLTRPLGQRRSVSRWVFRALQFKIGPEQRDVRGESDVLPDPVTSALRLVFRLAVDLRPLRPSICSGLIGKDANPHKAHAPSSPPASVGSEVTGNVGEGGGLGA
jgi:hypothetical protein